MTDIYDQHDKAFQHASAYVIVRDGEKVATIAFKFPRDGAGRLWAYVHWLGLPMVRGYAGGYGYDKRTASVAGAVKHMLATPEHDASWQVDLRSPENATAYALFRAALDPDDGWYWDTKLREAGFNVWQAV